MAGPVATLHGGRRLMRGPVVLAAAVPRPRGFHLLGPLGDVVVMSVVIHRYLATVRELERATGP